MALLSVEKRKAIFQYLGLGEYNEKNIKAFQKKYMLRKSDWDGVYGQNTDNTLRTVYFTKVYCKNFKPEEFRCECGGKYCCGYPSFMKPAMLQHIQKIRDHYDEPVTVTCGLRCKTYNSELGGSIQNSLHMQGLAVDFFQSGVTDPLSKRKSSIKWIAKQPNHHYSYGNGLYRLTTDKTYSGSVSAPYMGNCLHTDVYDNVEAEYPVYKEEKPKEKTYKVIDVSDWQSQIDWKKVKSAGVVGAIIRYADGTTLDKRFDENMKNAKAAGLHVGSYIFSRAKTKAEAEKEATRLYKACKPYEPDMPLYIDLEVSSLSKYANTVAQAFLNKMKSLGGRGGVYANLNWWNNYLVDTFKNYSANPFWIAQYNDKMTHSDPKAFGMWQYSSSGKVDGISTKVDMDKCYVAYWETAQKEEPPKEEEKPTPPKKTIDELAQEVLDGKWGSGEARKENLTKAGYDYDAVQKRVNELVDEMVDLPTWVKRANAWAEELADDPKAGYRKFNHKDKSTYECLLCHPETDPKHKWYVKTGNCIWESFAYWHHGGGIPCNCGCHVIDDTFMTKLLTMNKTKALKLLREKIGIDDIDLIRNNGKVIPKSKMKPGDLCIIYDSNNKATHIYPYIGDGYTIDCGNWSSKAKQIAKRKITPCKTIIRYTGK